MKFFRDASIHDHDESGFACAFGGRFIFHAFPASRRRVRRCESRRRQFQARVPSGENIHNIDFFRNVLDARVAFFPEHFGFVRIDRNDAVPEDCRYSRDAETRAMRFRGQANDSNCFCRGKSSVICASSS